LRVYRAEVIVLRRINLGETDKVVTLLSRQYGKLSAVAKGARKPTSRIAGATEVFSCCSVMLALGRNLDVLTQSEVKVSFPALRTDLGRFAAASYITELTDAILPERLPAPAIFDLLLGALSALQSDANPSLVARAFELHAAREQGYEPTFTVCAQCHAPLGSPAPGFSPALGGAVCASCVGRVRDAERVAPNVIRLAQRLLSVPLQRASESGAGHHELTTLGRLMRAHIEYRTERRVKSAEFMDALVATTQ